MIAKHLTFDGRGLISFTMARPKKGQEKHRPERVAFWVTEEIKEYLAKQSKRRRVSMGDIANEALEEKMSSNAEGKCNEQKQD